MNLDNYHKEISNENWITETYPGGDRYEGEFNDIKREGKGIYYFAEGEKYEGDFKDGKRDGKGVEVYVDSGKYEGSWKCDRILLQGIKNTKSKY